MELEEKVRQYIKEYVKHNETFALPISKIASEVDSSPATVWRALQKLEQRRIIKVIKPRLKTQPNEIYYIGEEEELKDIIDNLTKTTQNMLVMLDELKNKIREKDDTIFDLKKTLEKYNR